MSWIQHFDPLVLSCERLVPKPSLRLQGIKMNHSKMLYSVLIADHLLTNCVYIQPCSYLISVWEKPQPKGLSPQFLHGHSPCYCTGLQPTQLEVSQISHYLRTTFLFLCFLVHFLGSASFWLLLQENEILDCQCSLPQAIHSLFPFPSDGSMLSSTNGHSKTIGCIFRDI